MFALLALRVGLLLALACALAAAGVYSKVGLGRIVALHYRLSTSYQIH